jgi:hypothetical protein
MHGTINHKFISRLVLLLARNASDKRCREKQNTHFRFNNTFFISQIRAVYEIMWGKKIRTGQATDDDMAHAHCMMGT